MIEFIPIQNLSLLERNPRKINKVQFDKLCKSLKEDPGFLERRPCLVNKVGDDLIVYAGNQRVRAAQKLGWHQVPCIIDENLSSPIINSRVVKDNKTYGDFDYDILSSDWEIDELIDAGFTEVELGLDAMLGGDEPPTKKEKKKKECPNCGHEL
jgi:ParB-like chromosome segregation protein Spo0J